ncbi:MAG: hypothetical protein KJ749_04155 [Planctomycetes bacterium]|nr:hypothetical protein [Planctomycetota bacterium]
MDDLLACGLPEGTFRSPELQVGEGSVKVIASYLRFAKAGVFAFETLDRRVLGALGEIRHSAFAPIVAFAQKLIGINPTDVEKADILFFNAQDNDGVEQIVPSLERLASIPTVLADATYVQVAGWPAPQKLIQVL